MPAAAPALAIVLVTYDSAAYLPGTLAALLPQLGDDDELLVVELVLLLSLDLLSLLPVLVPSPLELLLPSPALFSSRARFFVP